MCSGSVRSGTHLLPILEPVRERGSRRRGLLPRGHNGFPMWHGTILSGQHVFPTAAWSRNVLSPTRASNVGFRCDVRFGLLGSQVLSVRSRFELHPEQRYTLLPPALQRPITV